MSLSWNREEITYCSCNALSYKHAHCPCARCDGKAVSRSTEYRHWVEANAERSRFKDASTNSATVLESHIMPIDIPAGTEVESIIEGPLPDEMDNSQDVQGIVRPDNDINGGMDMELETSQERHHSSSELTGNGPPQQNVISALTR